MKRYILMFALAATALPASAQGLSAGVFFGTPMSGVSIGQNNLRVSLGIEETGVAVDGLWNLGDWLARPEFSPMYAYTGAQWVDDKHHEWGPRAGLGIAVPMGHGNIELYGEAGSTWYWQEDAAFKFEGSFGLRMFF
ncbi:hypothetical protein K6Q96_20265 [Grimontia kaedaensis]|uniref:Outer membrane protein beta-barrel domain-containing protein n=1 Tax=Grimontia kaedaensis TaxID=2872157 RepID=A0ABY4X2Q4_9GAMM|nr:hypothetical protein [Grimontia kaedaensis]USH05535.1 hypothetical protein K6Q96_20265 [Grimontia kaedaensis]